MLYRAYVDEAGDRGFSAAACQYFVVSAVIVADADDALLRSELTGLRGSLGRHPDHSLHFVKFSHSERLKAAQDIGRSSLTAIASVVVHKELIARPGATDETSCMARPDAMYLRALGLLLERISSCVNENGGDEAIVTFSRLKGFRPWKLHDYRKTLEASDRIDSHWHVFDGHPFRIDGPKTVELLQIADITASALFRAIEPDRYGNTETRYLVELSPKLYRRDGVNVTECGLKTFPAEAFNPGEPLAFLRDF